MEKERNFKVVITQSNTKSISSTGKVQRSDPPINESEIVSGITSANVKGEANVIKTVARKTSTNPKGSGNKPKERNRTFYPNHTFVDINNVTIVLIPNSKFTISDYTDFIQATQDNRAEDLVDILPPLYPLHFKLIQDVDTRFMIGDSVNVNFKFRNILELKSIQQKETRTIKEIKLVNLGNMSAIVAYLDNNDYFPINELDHVRT